MTSRFTFTEFEELWQKDPERYGSVPLTQAAGSLDIDERALAPLIERGALELFEIGNDSFTSRMVSLKSLLIFKTARAARSQGRPERILEILTDLARKRQTLAYGDAMKAVGLNYQDAIHRQRFNADLTEATRNAAAYEQGLLICVLLVFRIQHLPCDHFFLMAQEAGFFTPGMNSKTVLFKDHSERIFQFYEGK
jgi:hypothetical protein